MGNFHVGIVIMRTTTSAKRAQKKEKVERIDFDYRARKVMVYYRAVSNTSKGNA